MRMKRIEQLAIVVPSVTRFISNAQDLGFGTWVTDEVDAVTVFKRVQRGEEARTSILEEIKYKIAFNYQMLPGTELEVIQGLEGESVNIDVWCQGIRTMIGGSNRLAHYGYRAYDTQDAIGTLFAELAYWTRRGCSPAQVTITRSHSKASDVRYLYGFADARHKIGAWIKIMTKIPKDDVPPYEELVKFFGDRFLND